MEEGEWCPADGTALAVVALWSGQERSTEESEALLHCQWDI